MTPSAGNPGLTLALCAAESALLLAIGDADGRLAHGQWITAPSRGAEVLTPAIASSLSLLEKSPEDIRRVAVVRGPGSFTGLRLTAATAAGLARTVGAVQAGIDYMDLLARECLPHLPPGGGTSLLWIVVRARRDLVYMQAFVRDGSMAARPRSVTALTTERIAPGDAVRHILDIALMHTPERMFLAGSGLHDNRDAFVAGLAVPGAPRVTLLETAAPMPNTLFTAALDAAYGEADIDPVYVRAADAEENLPHIAQRLGLDPDEAATRLRELTQATPDSGAIR